MNIKDQTKSYWIIWTVWVQFKTNCVFKDSWGGEQDLHIFEKYNSKSSNSSLLWDESFIMSQREYITVSHPTKRPFELVSKHSSITKSINWDMPVYLHTWRHSWLVVGKGENLSICLPMDGMDYIPWLT